MEFRLKAILLTRDMPPPKGFNGLFGVRRVLSHLDTLLESKRRIEKKEETLVHRRVAVTCTAVSQ
jgi:hypothetical protein